MIYQIILDDSHTERIKADGYRYENNVFEFFDSKHSALSTSTTLVAMYNFDHIQSIRPVNGEVV